MRLETKTPEHSPVLKAEHLSRSIAERAIVNDVTFEVYRGDILGVVGPSGAGKSSLLRLLNRLDEPTSGVFYVEGQDYRQIVPRELRRRIGMVMQTAYLFPGTVAENIRFGPRQRGENLPDAAIARLMEQVGLPDYADRSVANLSGGEAQRVALARALANSPIMLLMDEPTSALDEKAKREIEALICDIVRQNSLTCMIVTHDVAQAKRMANRVMLMESGRVVRIGPSEEVLSADRV